MAWPESCTTTEYEERCYYSEREKKRVCHTESITVNGHRTVEANLNYTEYIAYFDLISNAGQKLFSGKVSESDFDDDKKGPCIPDYDRRHDRRDHHNRRAILDFNDSVQNLSL